MSQRFFYPSLMGSSSNAPISKSDEPPDSSDVAVRELNGYGNAGLEVSNEFVGVANRELINRELVNLENAAVNIDNSSDVIIGPVTQFNVNGNVTIYQNKDGQPIGLDDKVETPNGTYNDQVSRPQKEEPDITFAIRKKLTLKIGIGLLFFLLTGTAVILVFVLRKNAQDPFENKDSIDIGNSSLGTHRLIPKQIWGGRAPKATIPLKTPVDFAIIKHTGGGSCDDFQSCAKKMQTLQSYDIADYELDDIYFNFAVGGDGNIYIGRGWDVQPAYTKYNLDLVMIGNYALDPFTPTMISATKALLEYGLSIGKLTDNYKLVNHNQTWNTMSPGKNVIVEVRTWPHYDPTSYLGEPLLVRTYTFQELVAVNKA